MAAISKKANDFLTSGIAFRSGVNGVNANGRIISSVGDPNGQTIVPTPSAGTVCIDANTGAMYQYVSGTSWNTFTVGGTVTTLDFKNSVRVASTANVATPLTTAPNTLDGISLIQGDRVLLKNQTLGQDNGIYVVTTLGTGANGVWTRALDADSSAEFNTGAFIPVEEGTVNASSFWLLTTVAPIVLGTTPIVFKNFGTYVAGNGITLTGNSISVTAQAANAVQVTGSGVGLVLPAVSGLAQSASGLNVVVDPTTPTLSMTATGLKVLIPTALTSGLTATAAGLVVELDETTGALAHSASGLKVVTPAVETSGLTISGTGIAVTLDPSSGLVHSATGIKAVVDTTNGSTALVGNAIVVPGLSRKTIASSTASQIVDTIPLASFTGAKWLVNIKNATGARYLTEILSVGAGLGLVDSTEYGTVVLSGATPFVANPVLTVTADATNMILTYTGDASVAINVERTALA